ncbi:MAG: DNA polymerase III subunit delta [Polyangia bacterium]
MPPKTPAAKKSPSRGGSGVSLEGPAALDTLDRIDSTTAQPVYLVYGKERYLVDRALELLRARVLDPRTRDFNYELYQAKEAGADRIVNAARTLPMMAKRRLVLVRDFDSLKADDQAKLIPYLEDPAPESVLVLEADKLDSRTRFGAAVKKHATCIKLEPLYERQLIGFVRTEAKRRKLTLDTGAGELLCEEIGADLGALADTVERLALWSESRGGGPVSARDVEAQVPGGRQRTVFELADAVGKGDRGRALTILASMLESRESGVRVVAMLARHVRQLWSADGLMRQKTPKSELASALGVPPFFVDGIIDQARRVATSRGSGGGEVAFRALHEALVRADRELKSSRLDEARIMERLVLDLTPQQVRA